MDSLDSDLGTVVDLSSVGMRVASKGKPNLQVGQSGRIKIRSGQGALSVTGRVVWIRRKGLRKFEMGIEFIHVKKSLTTALSQLAEFGFIGGPGGPTTRSEPDTEPIRATINMPDYYKVLGLSDGAPADDIRAAYRELARKYHPDSAKNEADVEKFVEIQEAYNTLRDEATRKSYDQRRAG